MKLPYYSKTVLASFQDKPTKEGGIPLIFQQILLEIFNKLKNERTVSSAYHILRGKRSGSTIQDVGIFQLHSYFNILPKLSREVYNNAIDQLIHREWIEVRENQYYVLLKSGLEQLHYQKSLFFDGWHYRGNEHLFFARLSLIVQSLSHQKANVKTFRPIQKDETVQRWVKHFLLTNHYQNGHLQNKLYKEIVMSLEKTNADPPLKNIVSHRLSGYKTPGFTWQQISSRMNISELDAQILFIACLHSWLKEMEINSTNYPLLNRICEGVRIANTLTSSTVQTANLFRKGYSVEQISEMRRLKTSTIEDHLVELAMNEPTFPIIQFISEQQIREVWEAVEGYNTRKLKILHEVLPQLTYFQIRLVLAKGEKDV